MLGPRNRSTHQHFEDVWSRPLTAGWALHVFSGFRRAFPITAAAVEAIGQVCRHVDVLAMTMLTMMVLTMMMLTMMMLH